jgi:chemotaxis-related protein WspD
MSDDAACWSTIGVTGDRSCPQLVEHVHCRNCPVYCDVARTLFEAPSNPTYLAEWSAHVATPKVVPDANVESVLIFRIAGEWLALPSHAVLEVAATRTIHSLPHRRSGAVLGIANVRGELLVCIALEAMLGLNASGAAAVPAVAASPQRLLVVGGPMLRVACPVDEVQGIHRVKPTDVRRVPATVGNAGTTYSKSVASWRDHTIGVLDDARLLAGFERSIA